MPVTVGGSCGTLAETREVAVLPRIVMTAMPAAGHVNPSAPLIGELLDRGVDVTVYATEEFRPLVERLGAEFCAYPEGTISSGVIAKATSEGGSPKVAQRIFESTRLLLPFLQAELQDRSTEAIMFDSNALWGRMVATNLGLPAISLMTTMRISTSELRGLSARESLPLLRQTFAALPGLLRARRRLRQGVGAGLLPPSPVLPAQGDLTLFPLPEWMQVDSDRDDPTCHYVGPTFDAGTRTEEVDGPLRALLNRDGPLIVVSLGTLHSGGEDFFRACVEAFAGLPATVLLVVGRRTEPPSPDSLPAHIAVRSVVPQLEVLQHAAAFVTHGGMNSVLEALQCGLPMVVVPQHVEQLCIGQAVAQQSGAVVLRHHLHGRQIRADELRTAVQTLLSHESYRAGAQALGRSLHAGGGTAAAADQIDRLLRSAAGPPS